MTCLRTLSSRELFSSFALPVDDLSNKDLTVSVIWKMKTSSRLKAFKTPTFLTSLLKRNFLDHDVRFRWEMGHDTRERRALSESASLARCPRALDSSVSLGTRIFHSLRDPLHFWTHVRQRCADILLDAMIRSLSRSRWTTWTWIVFEFFTHVLKFLRLHWITEKMCLMTQLLLRIFFHDFPSVSESNVSKSLGCLVEIACQVKFTRLGSERVLDFKVFRKVSTTVSRVIRNYRRTKNDSEYLSLLT